jgi:hypothetical protein
MKLPSDFSSRIVMILNAELTTPVHRTAVADHRAFDSSLLPGIASHANQSDRKQSRDKSTHLAFTRCHGRHVSLFSLKRQLYLTKFAGFCDHQKQLHNMVNRMSPNSNPASLRSIRIFRVSILNEY